MYKCQNIHIKDKTFILQKLYRVSESSKVWRKPKYNYVTPREINVLLGNGKVLVSIKDGC